MDQCKIDRDLCKGCGLCVKFCPKKALEISDVRNSSGYHPACLARPDDCIACAICAEMCPEVAITIYRRQKAHANKA